MKSSTGVIFLKLPNNLHCWNCGAPLTSDTIQVRHALAICCCCAEAYDHYEKILPQIADHPLLANSTVTMYGVKCYSPQPGQPQRPDEAIWRNSATRQNWLAVNKRGRYADASGTD